MVLQNTLRVFTSLYRKRFKIFVQLFPNHGIGCWKCEKQKKARNDPGFFYEKNIFNPQSYRF
jgi:hypothetical protein